MLKTVLMAALAAGLAGCSGATDRTLVTGSVRPAATAVVAPTLVSEVAPEYAVAYLPAIAGPVAGIRQSSSRDKVAQVILYPDSGYGEGENALEVTVTSTTLDARYFQAPTLRDLQLELRRRFPDVAMKIVQVPDENLAGIFGYAIGRSATGGQCIYGWQTVRAASRNDKQGLARFQATDFAAKVRLRYCSRSLPETALVSLMRGLRLREVNDATIDMLRFAEGSGSLARAAPQAFAAPAPVAATPAPEIRPRPARREAAAVVDDASPIDIPRAPRTAMPETKTPATVGDVADATGADVPRPRVTAPAEAVRVPLPKLAAN